MVRWLGVEWIGGRVNAHNTLHQSPALLQAWCVSSPFMFLFSTKGRSKRRRQDMEEKVKREWSKHKWKSSNRHERKSSPSACLRYDRLRGMAGLVLGHGWVKMWLQWGCHIPSLPVWSSVYQTTKCPKKPHYKAIRIKKKEQISKKVCALSSPNYLRTLQKAGGRHREQKKREREMERVGKRVRKRAQVSRRETAHALFCCYIGSFPHRRCC